jgi:hypothetical protein
MPREIERESSLRSGPSTLEMSLQDCKADVSPETVASVPDTAASRPVDDLQRPQFLEATEHKTGLFVPPTSDPMQKPDSPHVRRNIVPRQKAIATADPITPMAETTSRDSLQRADIVTRAELAKLDVENKKFRAMLAGTLRSQNAQLKTMLRRFGFTYPAAKSSAPALHSCRETIQMSPSERVLLTVPFI